LATSFVVLAACGSSDPNDETSDANSETSAPSTDPLVTEPPSTDPVLTDVATSEVPVDFGDQWETVAAPADCMCADGSEYSWFVREADPTKVMFYLEGGGACFTAEMCASGSGNYKESVGAGGSGATTGVFDLANPDNPFAEWSMVYVPYCTGDVHAGDTTKDYGDGVVIEHKGFVNGTTALRDLADRFGGATEVVVAGSSAGAFPTPIYGGLTAELLPDAMVKVISDSGGAIPDAMSAVVGNWGTIETLPDWPEFAGTTPADFNPPFTFIVAGARNPSMTFARHDYAYDNVLSSYARMAGLSPDGLVDVMRAGEARIEAAGTTVSSWVGPGDAHTILGRNEMYSEELNRVRFIEWLRAFLDGTPLADNYCIDCAG